MRVRRGLELSGLAASMQSAKEELPIPINAYLKGAVFDPSAIEVMATAFEGTCKSLQVSESSQIVREVIAMHVMKFAQRGERDPIKLQAEVVKVLNLEPDR